MTTLDLASRSAERGQLLASIDDLEELIRQSVQESENERTLPISCVEAMRAADLFRIAAPKAVGGLEVDPLTHMEIVEAMARVDGSAAWTLMIGAHGGGIIGTFASDEACQAVFGGSRWPVAGSQMAPHAGRFRRVDGGVVVSGRWSFASGIRHAEWSMATATETGGDADRAPGLIAALLPTNEVTILDNWHVSGLKGTGSCDYSLDEKFIADEMSWSMPPTLQRGGPRYRIKMPQATLAAFAIGVARRSLDEIATQALAKVRPGAANTVATRPYFHHVLGEAEMRLSGARSALWQLVESMWSYALTGEEIPTEMDLRLNAMPAYVHGIATDITTAAFRFGGSGAARLDNPLQRNVRDLAVAAQHIQASEQTFEVLGRGILGLDD